MAEEDMDAVQELSAGDFSTWLSAMQSALRGERASEVPCGDCTACCTSSQFIHVGPDETETLAQIPTELLFPAPGLPEGHVLMGYDENGHCPMLKKNQCSIYQHRPRTCRTYDCRIFPATGLDLDQIDKASIARQARRWKFSYATDVDRLHHSAILAAGKFLREHPACLPDGVAPTNPTQVAVLAVKVHEAFLQLDDETGYPRKLPPQIPIPHRRPD